MGPQKRQVYMLRFPNGKVYIGTTYDVFQRWASSGAHLCCMIMSIIGGNVMKGTATEIVNKIKTDTNTTQKQLAENLGITQQTIFRMLKNNNGMRTDNFVKMLSAMGADVVVRIDGQEYVVTE